MSPRTAPSRVQIVSSASQTESPAKILAALLHPFWSRPLFWTCLCALVGVALGGQVAQGWQGLAREEAPLWWFASPLVFGLLLALRFRRSPALARTGVALFIAALFGFHTARRLLPPRNDVSWQATLGVTRAGPVNPRPVALVGLIADYPKRSEFNLRFPLEVETLNGHASKGRVWVSAPFGSRVDIGDRLALRAQLRPLPRPANSGERAAFWPQIIAGCWCQSGELQQLEVVGRGAAFGPERRVQAVRRAILARYETLFCGGQTEKGTSQTGDENTLARRPFPRQNAALLTAMVWGENGLFVPLPKTIRADFRGAGLSHFLVASGTQVSLVLAALFLLARGLGVRRGWLVLWILPGLVVYATLAGAAPSIGRAVVSGILAALCLASGRDLDALSLWGAALSGLLLLDPALAWSLSLQLTFAGVFGLLVLSPPFFRVVKRLNSGALGKLAAMSLGAQSATLPLSLLHFGTASAAGLGANFLAVPLAGVLVFAGVLALVLPISGPLYELTRSVGDIAHFAAHPLGAQVNDLSPSLSWAFGCYVLLLGGAFSLSEEWQDARAAFQRWWHARRASLAGSNPRAVCAVLLLCALALTARGFYPHPKTLRVTVLDVGQGLCVLVQEPNGRAALIDGGSLEGANRADIGSSVIVPALRDLGVERLDYVFLTHPDASHCNGLKRVLEEVPVGAFVDGPRAGQGKSDPLRDLLGGQADLDGLRREVSRRGILTIVPASGEQFRLGEAKLRVLGPQFPLSPSQNDNSLVLRIEWKGRTVLLPGDLEAQGEKRLARHGSPLRCDVLVAARNGASTSSSAEWVRACSAGATIVSCGKYNKMNDPSPRVLDAFARSKTPLFRTDLDGALSIECDPDACRITPQNP